MVAPHMLDTPIYTLAAILEFVECVVNKELSDDRHIIICLTVSIFVRFIIVSECL